MSSNEIESKIKTFAKYDLVVKNFSLSLSDSIEVQPFLEFDRTSYPGFEAHIFTIADASLWMPELTPADDVALLGPRNQSGSSDSWMKLLNITQEIMESLARYRQGLKHGIIPSSHWMYHELKWYRKNWEGSFLKLKPVDDFLYSVDESIRSHIKELNELGFSTTQSCSGLVKEHTDREPYLPYVMFDERAYPRSSAHLFTLADITGWIPSYGPHNFDIEFRLPSPEGAERFWNSLIVSARKLAKLLSDYRDSFKDNHQD